MKTDLLRLFWMGVVLLVIWGHVPAFAGNEDDDDKKKVSRQHDNAATLRASLLYGESVNFYSLESHNPITASSLASRKPRSVGAAFALSAVVPGAGQAYNRQWGKAIVALALEAAIITGAIVWRNQGNDLEDDYQAYAHAYWDPVKYGNWLNDYSTYIQGAPFNYEVTTPAVVIPTQIDFRHPENWSDAEWNTVLDFFGQIQATERQMVHVQTGAAFSHILPDFSEQQYYELIGKYFQFAPGWDDYPEWRDENGEIIPDVIDSSKGEGLDRDNVPANSRFFTYADDHAHANDVLRRASRITTLLIVTHFASAIEAAISAKLHNDRIQPSLEIGQSGDGRLRTVASLKIRF